MSACRVCGCDDYEDRPFCDACCDAWLDSPECTRRQACRGDERGRMSVALMDYINRARAERMNGGRNAENK